MHYTKILHILRDQRMTVSRQNVTSKNISKNTLFILRYFYNKMDHLKKMTICRISALKAGIEYWQLTVHIIHMIILIKYYFSIQPSFSIARRA